MRALVLLALIALPLMTQAEPGGTQGEDYVIAPVHCQFSDKNAPEKWSKPSCMSADVVAAEWWWQREIPNDNPEIDNYQRAGVAFKGCPADYPVEQKGPGPHSPPDWAQDEGASGFTLFCLKEQQECESDDQPRDLGELAYHEPELPVQACDDGCTVMYSGSVTADQVSESGDEPVYFFQNAKVQRMGETCTVGEGGSDAATEVPDDAPECDEGEMLGKVNGEWSCQPTGGDDGGGGDNGDGSDGGDEGDGNGGDGDTPDGNETKGEIRLPNGDVREIELDTEGLAQEKTTQQIRDELKKLTDEQGATDEPKTKFQDKKDEAWSDTKIDDNVDKVESGNYERMGAREDADGLGSTVENAFPDVGCSGVTMEIYEGHSWTISCADTAQVRGILSWVFYVLTAVGIFQVLFESSGGRG